MDLYEVLVTCCDTDVPVSHKEIATSAQDAVDKARDKGYTEILTVSRLTKCSDWE
jgi:hypothetical protein